MTWKIPKQLYGFKNTNKIHVESDKISSNIVKCYAVYSNTFISKGHLK